jgi:hypothetical protein
MCLHRRAVASEKFFEGCRIPSLDLVDQLGIAGLGQKLPLLTMTPGVQDWFNRILGSIVCGEGLFNKRSFLREFGLAKYPLTPIQESGV